MNRSKFSSEVNSNVGKQAGFFFSVVTFLFYNFSFKSLRSTVPVLRKMRTRIKTVVRATKPPKVAYLRWEDFRNWWRRNPKICLQALRLWFWCIDNEQANWKMSWHLERTSFPPQEVVFLEDKKFYTHRNEKIANHDWNEIPSSSFSSLSSVCLGVFANSLWNEWNEVEIFVFNGWLR